ncbi:hypothetical protein D3Y59_06550 [Hymenobacter oligotrophus]|uniref:Uncharacterized protein n=1 Tax=Hymenobacter oligotrophus TaxID=2319843 RepID=A0A3B7RB56_9BACT|nr:hypothetical protein D3Y59_06550 [Hymenobacter oligotrophus]
MIGLLALVAAPALAQTNPASTAVTTGVGANENLAAMGRLGSFSMAVPFDNRYIGMKGTPYTVPRWLPGTIYMRRGVQASDLPLKYDSFSQRLLALRPSKDSIMVDLNQVDKFVLRETLPGVDGKATVVAEHFYQRLSSPTAAIRDAFVEVLYARQGGKYELYKLPRKIFIKSERDQGYNSGRDYNEIMDVNEFHVKLPSGAVAKIAKPGNKQLEAVLPKADAERFKALKINIRTEEDLRKAIAQLDAQ